VLERGLYFHKSYNCLITLIQVRNSVLFLEVTRQSRNYELYVRITYRACEGIGMISCTDSILTEKNRND
jgi:hypothetical protein